MTISFFRFDGLFARLWAFAQMGLARPALRRHPNVGFWHLLGTGSGEGFTPLPNTGVYAILATWPNLNAARAAGATQPFARYHRRASEAWTLTLTPTTARGQWSRETPFTVVAAAAKGCGPVVALTRASIRARSLWHFWSRAPAISRMIGTNSDVIFKAGLGEHPFASQITFSIWPDAGRMAAFARDPAGPHQQAIDAVRRGGWFSEELYARFAITAQSGSWGGAETRVAEHLRPT